ncbi:MAG: KH domain-containing protein [Patescibacteria group bacterium]
MSDQEFVQTIVKAIVDHPEDVKTERVVDDKGILISLTVNEEDMGKIIGKGGRTVNSIRKLLHVLGAKTDERINLKIYEPDGQEVSTPTEDSVVEEPEKKEEVVEESAPEKPKDEPKLDDVPTDVLV